MIDPHLTKDMRLKDAIRPAGNLRSLSSPWQCPAPGTCPCASLSAPRLRATLHRLVAGDSEKEAARCIGISRNTLHVYVTSLYRHFSVSDRAELILLWHQHVSDATRSARERERTATPAEPNTGRPHSRRPYRDAPSPYGKGGELSRWYLSSLLDRWRLEPSRDERRQMTRVGIWREVRIVCKPPAGPREVQLLDVSRGGVGLVSGLGMRLGMEFWFILERQPDQEVAALCRVRHCTQIRSRTYRVGAEFESLASWWPGAPRTGYK